MIIADKTRSTTRLECGSSLRTFLQSPSQYWINGLWAIGCRIAIQYWAGLWYFHWESTSPPSTSTRFKGNAKGHAKIGRSEKAFFSDKAFHVEVPRDIPFEFCKWKGTCLGTWARYPVQTPFVTLLLWTLRAFGKGVSEKAFHLEVPRGIPFLFRRQKGTYLGTQGTYHLKLLFWNSFPEHPIKGTNATKFAVFCWFSLILQTHYS